MKKFLAIFLGEPTGKKVAAWQAQDPQTLKAREAAGMKAWGEWMQKHAAHVVDAGGPLGKTKRVDGDGVADVKNLMAAYVVVQAESHDEAARLFEGHPHFSIFPGEAIEVMDCPPIPRR